MALTTATPLVGILTSMTKNNRLDGSKETFQRIQRELLAQGGSSFLFTASSVRENEIDGFLYLPEKKKWVKKTCPYPQIVYNRIPYRDEEETLKVQQTNKIFQKNGIPFFNPHFFHKQDIYHILKQDDRLFPYLPNTIAVHKKEQFLAFLATFKSVYGKPTKQAKGTGIYRITYVSEAEAMYQSIASSPTLMPIEDIWSLLQQEDYLLQEAISCNTIGHSRYDLRVLVHFVKGEFVVSGIGVRLGKEDAITTHVPHGGKVIPLSMIPPINKEEIQFLAATCGNLLQEAYGTVYEFSLDIGVQGKQYYLFEINSKPMVFDEPDIKKAGLHHLMQIFQEHAKKH